MDELKSFGATFWEDNYKLGGTSGEGSYGRSAEFKARVINKFLATSRVRTAIEFGCGDGHQLSLIGYENYTGYDTSPTAVQMCRDKFKGDESKEFRLISEYDGRRADLTLSLDVIYHIIEDEVFDMYMRRLFHAANKYVIVYAVDEEIHPEDRQAIMYHRKFSRWVEDNASKFERVDYVANDCGYMTNFYIYGKIIK